MSVSKSQVHAAGAALVFPMDNLKHGDKATEGGIFTSAVFNHAANNVANTGDNLCDIFSGRGFAKEQTGNSGKMKAASWAADPDKKTAAELREMEPQGVLDQMWLRSLAQIRLSHDADYNAAKVDETTSLKPEYAEKVRENLRTLFAASASGDAGLKEVTLRILSIYNAVFSFSTDVPVRSNKAVDLTDYNKMRTMTVNDQEVMKRVCGYTQSGGSKKLSGNSGNAAVGGGSIRVRYAGTNAGAAVADAKKIVPAIWVAITAEVGALGCTGDLWALPVVANDENGNKLQIGKGPANWTTEDDLSMLGGVSFNRGKAIFKKAQASSSPNEDVYKKIVGNLSASSGEYSGMVSRDNNGKLVVKLGDKLVSPLEWLQSKSYDFCSAVGSIENDRNKCDNLSKCVAEIKDLFASSECVNLLADKSLWKFTNDQIRGMQPVIAYNLIKGLGFEGVKKTVGDKTVVHVEPVNAWWEKLSNGKLHLDGEPLKTDTQVTNAANTDTKSSKEWVESNKPALNKYLSAVVAYINDNPDMINKDKVHQANSGFNPAKRGTVKGSDPYQENARMIGLVNEASNNTLNSFASLLAQLGLVGLAGDQDGGSGMITYRSKVSQLSKMPKYSKTLREIYNHYVSKLKSLGKKLTEKTEESVEKVFKSLEKNEQELEKWMEWLEKYAVLAREMDDPNQFVSFDEMKKAYNKFQKKLNKVTRNTVALINIDGTLYTALVDANKDGSSVNLPSKL